MSVCRWSRRTSETPIHPGRFCASVSRDFLVESGSCGSPCMSVDGYLHGTRRRPLPVTLARFNPFQEFVFQESPCLPLSFTKRMGRNITEARPANHGPAVHAEN